MMIRILFVSLLLAAPFHLAVSADELPDTSRDILVTFDNKGARAASGGLGAPYRNRKRYAITRSARQNAAAVEAEHNLVEIEHWPIRSLSVYCFVYRVPEGAERSSVIARLRQDERVESVQPLQRFNTSMDTTTSFNDTYAKLQYGLEVLDIGAAHQSSLGSGIRVAIVDSYADENHEDLRGRIRRTLVFVGQSKPAAAEHGTAVASVIGALSNNSRGMVGVAPEATLDVYVSCWSDTEGRSEICDSFTLLKALDKMHDDPPDLLNLSLIGPHDPLLERLLIRLLDAGTIIVAAGPSKNAARHRFPAEMERVIGVASSADAEYFDITSADTLFAPGDRILVAVPDDAYDFRSGSSLAAAHVSGVIALLLSRSPDHSSDSVRSILRRSQRAAVQAHTSINACKALNLAESSDPCTDAALAILKKEP